MHISAFPKEKLWNMMILILDFFFFYKVHLTQELKGLFHLPIPILF